MTDKELRDLARWLLGEEAESDAAAGVIEFFVRQWKARPGAAERWAEVRARERKAVQS